jgi:toxin CcdB
MAQFDVHENRDEGPNGASLLLDLQSDFLASLPSRLVAPLRSVKSFPTRIDRLHPLVTVGGKRYVLVMSELAAVSRRLLGPKVGSLESRRFDINKAMDFIISGF